ncbi:endolytic transglycosylase MltG [Anaerovorax odorimutans]|uniref:Endolytic murein transglycosylase n=1 Tax=Anaerovorax odorimutans TaxID=109327 RepID=A0ABT1RL34_9FIRM|nr:endolytic transglycosylase MltG [Anaerovorax odorimutans]MCQ4635900.1 endolytic transglycosylase MltG [Anaerovorax odorimutans]
MKRAYKDTRGKSGIKLVIILAVIVLVLAGGLFFYVHGISATDPGNKDKVSITIEPGTGTLQILNQLDEAGLVQNKLCGKIYVKLSSPDSIQANTYVLSKDMTLTEIFSAMNSGDPAYTSQSKFTIIEGATIPQAAEAISKESGLAEKDILDKWSDKTYLKALIKKYWFLADDILNKDLKYPLEGYLYPETYFLSEKDPDIEKITETMLNKMGKELTPIKEDIKSKLNMSVHQFLSFASVVERESLFEADRPKIAGVFKNRLDKNMALQSDITVLYALDRTGVKVSIKETQVDSKYNTYKNKGLPVGPICAVPRSTMDDCLNYEPSDYLFFFATKDGKVLYSKTYAEHQKIVKENKWY